MARLVTESDADSVAGAVTVSVADAVALSVAGTGVFVMEVQPVSVVEAVAEVPTPAPG